MPLKCGKQRGCYMLHDLVTEHLPPKCDVLIPSPPPNINRKEYADEIKCNTRT